jgi:antitoxin component YwqK of YwqJK toxin-antitoxin module
MKIITFSSVCFLVLISCTQQKTPEKTAEKTAEKTEDDGSQIRIIEEFHPNGNLKSSVEAMGNLRHGISKHYRYDGTLENDITYELNRKNGVARNYYPDGKTVKMEVNYLNGKRHGEAKWCFSTGKTYRLTPYEDNKINGVRRTYYESGALQAELAYKDNQPGTGLKEYSQEGKLKEFNAVILTRDVDRISLDNSFTVVLSLSDGTQNVEFFKGELTDGVFWNEKLVPLNTENGKGELKVFVPKGSFKMETVNIVARIKTSLGNNHILQKEYNLAVENKY